MPQIPIVAVFCPVIFWAFVGEFDASDAFDLFDAVFISSWK